MTLGEMEVGDVVYLRVDGSYTPFRVMHHGKPGHGYDDSYLGGTILCLDYSAEPFTTQMVSDPEEDKAHYGKSYLHETLNQAWLAKLDSAMAQQVMEVKLPYRTDSDGYPYEMAQGAEGLPAKVWLPSIGEVTTTMEDDNGNADLPYIYEGSLFAYWQGADLSRYLLWKNLNSYGIDNGWGIRTPNLSYGLYDHAPYFYKVMADGRACESTENAIAVRPCLVMPDSLMVDGDNYLHILGSVPVKVGGVWKEGAVWSCQKGAWSEATAVAAKVGGVWKE